MRDTDDSGTRALQFITRPAEIEVTARKIGYVKANRIFQLNHADTLSFTLALRGVAQTLEAVKVTARAPREFYFIDADGIAESDKPLRNELICTGRSVYCVRQGPWALLINGNSGARVKGGFTEAELYNLSDDPAQKNDLIKTMPDKAKELEALLEKCQKQGHTRPDWESQKPHLHAND